MPRLFYRLSQIVIRKPVTDGGFGSNFEKTINRVVKSLVYG